jgi:hypothetical protein
MPDENKIPWHVLERLQNLRNNIEALELGIFRLTKTAEEIAAPYSNTLEECEELLNVLPQGVATFHIRERMNQLLF